MLKNAFRMRWKWIAGIGGAVASSIWLYWFNIHLATTLRLRPAPPGFAVKVSFDVHSSRLIKLVNTGYSIEVQTPAGSTNYRTLFLGQGAYLPVGAPILMNGSQESFMVATPTNANAFRVSIDLEEQSAFYSGLFRWTFDRPDRLDNPFNRRIREWLVRTHRKGVPRTVWSPWVVRSNDVWTEKIER